MIVTIRSATDGSVITASTIAIKATNIDTGETETKTLTVPHLGVLKFDNPTLLCEGSNVRLEVDSSTPGFVESQTQIYYRIDKRFEEVDFFVSTV